MSYFIKAARTPATTNMSVRSLALMEFLAHNPIPQQLRDVAAGLNISKPATTRAVDMLQEAGLVSRDPDPKDKRCVHLRLTKLGAKLLNQVQ